VSALPFKMADYQKSYSLGKGRQLNDVIEEQTGKTCLVKILRKLQPGIL